MPKDQGDRRNPALPRMTAGLWSRPDFEVERSVMTMHLDKIFDQLSTHWQAAKTHPIKDRFKADQNRFAAFSRNHNGMLLDFSKSAIDEKSLALLLELARAIELEAKRDAMFRGDRINKTENRAVLHTALRRRDQTPLMLDDHDIMRDIIAEREKMLSLAEGVRSGKYQDQPAAPLLMLSISALAARTLAPQWQP